MKLIQFAFLAVVANTALVNAQDESFTISRESTAARILGKIPDGTPPPPPAPKLEYQVAKSDILDTTTHKQGGRTITIQQIRPIALPPPPPPPAEPATAALDEEFSARLADYRAAHPTHELLFLSATVFRSKDSPPRTLVRWWPQGGGGSVNFWSSADFALIAGGINSFEDAEGNVHSLLMGWGNVDIDRMAELRAAKGRQYDAPNPPDFPAGNATWQLTGNQPAAEDLVAIQALHELYNSNLAELKTARTGRERARMEREAWLKAHPPQPKNITLNYWRTEKPAANAKGDRP